MKIYLLLLITIAFIFQPSVLLHAQRFQFDSSIDAEEFLEKVLAEFGMNTYDIKIVPSDETSNAEAEVKNERRYIYYNQDWMRDIGSTYNDSEHWLKMGIITHELGHHMKGHTLTKGGTNHKLELEADWWSGFAMRKFGADLEEALIAVGKSTRFATKTHPTRRDRIKAVTAGYRGEPYSPSNNNNSDYNAPPTDNSARSGVRTVSLGGQSYSVKRFGELTWMTENLNYQIENSWCFEDSKSNCNKYGRLYTWEAAKKACQAVGWRLPTDQEWKERWNIAKAFGGVDDDASDGGEAAYEALIPGGSIGFSAQLGGRRYSNDSFYDLGDYGYYWSATENDSDRAWYYGFYRLDGKLDRYSFDGKTAGFSCRCVQE